VISAVRFAEPVAVGFSVLAPSVLDWPRSNPQRTTYLRRARSLGARRQLFDLLAYALVQNSVARHRHRLRADPAAEIAA
jgi:hypothetical protein